MANNYLTPTKKNLGIANELYSGGDVLDESLNDYNKAILATKKINDIIKSRNVGKQAAFWRMGQYRSKRLLEASFPWYFQQESWKDEEDFLDRLWREPETARFLWARIRFVSSPEHTYESGKNKDIDYLTAKIIDSRYSRFRDITYQTALGPIYGIASYSIEPVIKRDEEFGYLCFPNRITNIDTRMIELQHESGDPFYYWVIYSARGNQIRRFTPAEKDRIIIAPYNSLEKDRGRGTSLIDTIYHFWKLKIDLISYLARACERFGIPWLIATAKTEDLPDISEAGTFDVDEILDSLTLMRGDGVIFHSLLADIKPFEPSGQGLRAIIETIKYCDLKIGSAILGSPQVFESSGGSFALAASQKSILYSYIEPDREFIEQVINTQVIELIFKQNKQQFLSVGAKSIDDLPYIKLIKNRDMSDYRANVQVMNNLAPTRIDIDKIAKILDISLISEEEARKKEVINASLQASQSNEQSVEQSGEQQNLGMKDVSDKMPSELGVSDRNSVRSYRSKVK